MQKAQRKRKAQPMSDEDEPTNEGGEEMLLVGGSDELGQYDDSQFQENDEKKKTKGNNVVHLHFQQRTARKCLTLVQGMPDDLDLKKIIRHFKKAWCCNGTTVEHDEWGTIIQLQGDHRRDILKFLIEEGISYKENIKVHGHY